MATEEIRLERETVLGVSEHMKALVKLRIPFHVDVDFEEARKIRTPPGFMNATIRFGNALPVKPSPASADPEASPEPPVPGAVPVAVSEPVIGEANDEEIDELPALHRVPIGGWITSDATDHIALFPSCRWGAYRHRHVRVASGFVVERDDS
jgi:hypothetical protein